MEILDDKSNVIGTAKLFAMYPASLHFIPLQEDEVAISDFNLLDELYADKHFPLQQTSGPLLYGDKDVGQYYIKIKRASVQLKDTTSTTHTTEAQRVSVKRSVSEIDPPVKQAKKLKCLGGNCVLNIIINV
jgi:hypothetical protein